MRLKPKQQRQQTNNRTSNADCFALPFDYPEGIVINRLRKQYQLLHNLSNEISSSMAAKEINPATNSEVKDYNRLRLLICHEDI